MSKDDLNIQIPGDEMSRKQKLVMMMGLVNSSIIGHQAHLQYLIKKYTEYQKEYNDIVAEEEENGEALQKTE